jgi:hypothetical protein
VVQFERRIPSAAKQLAEKVVFRARAVPQRLKPYSKHGSYRSGKPLYPITPKPGVLGPRRCATQNQGQYRVFPQAKAAIDFAAFTAAAEAVPFQNKVKSRVFHQTAREGDRKVEQ